MVVPKQIQPAESPRRLLCIDYQAVNNLLPLVTKAHPKAKGVLALVSLLIIDEMYAKLAGLNI